MKIAYEKPALGEGGFGRVYKARAEIHGEESRVIALKKARRSDYVAYPCLLHEVCGLVLVKDHPSIPQAFGWGRSQYFEYLALELLDCDLCYWLKSEPLSRRNFVCLVLQMIAAVKHVHANGILHCDIKPENFMFGLGENAGRIYLIDFNLWTAWRSFEPPYKHLTRGRYGTAARGFRGTYTYASINCQLDKAVSRRDDLESLAYTIFFLYAGSLPWSKLGNKDPKEIIEYKQICQQSRALQGTCEYPLGDFVYYAQELTFQSEPEYDRWRELFWRVDNDTSDSLPGSDPLYDPMDTTEKVPWNMDFVDWERTGENYIIKGPAKRNTGRMRIAPGSNGGYSPKYSSWGMPHTMLSVDAFPHEQDIIRNVIQHISQPPTTTYASLSDSCDPEEMRRFDAPIPFKIKSEEESDGERVGEVEMELHWMQGPHWLASDDDDDENEDKDGDTEGQIVSEI